MRAFLKRAICAAALIGIGGPAQAEEVVVNVNWRFQEIVDPITDERRAAIFSRGDGGTIILKCDKPGPQNVYFQLSTEAYLGGKFERRFMEWRVDKNQPVREMWSYTRSLAIHESDPLFNQIMRGKSLFMRAMKYNGQSVDASFSVAGFEEAFARFAAVCVPLR